MSAFSPLVSTTEMTNTSHTPFGVQLSASEGVSEREGGVEVSDGASGGDAGIHGGGDRAVDAPLARNQQQAQQQRQYWHRRRQMHAPALSVSRSTGRASADPTTAVELQQRRERVAEITASNHRYCRCVALLVVLLVVRVGL